MADVKKLEVPEPLSRLGEAFREDGHELYLVGGYVRDRLLGGAGPDADAQTRRLYQRILGACKCKFHL